MDSMEWYVLHVMTGCEADVAQQMERNGYKVILPYVPIFLKRGGKLSVIKRPMLPGYVLTYTDPLVIYKMQQTDFLQMRQRKIIRICGDIKGAVPIEDAELAFFQCVSASPIWPLELRFIRREQNALGQVQKIFDIVNAPPWVQRIRIEWFDKSQFTAKIRLNVKNSSQMDDFPHVFQIAAFNREYTGKYREQLLQGLSTAFHDRFEEASG